MTRFVVVLICSQAISVAYCQPGATAPTSAPVSNILPLMTAGAAMPATATLPISTYETPAPVPAATVLPASALKGPGYKVGPDADPDGMLYSFSIKTDWGTFEPQSLQMTRVRLAEFSALNRLQKISEEPTFLQGMSKQLESTVQATGKAIMNPVKTIKQMPLGFKKFAGDIQAQSAVGRVYGESGSPAYAQVKRELASKLGVDPYTDNQPLQELLNQVAKNRNRGQLVASIGTLVVGGGAGLALNAVEMNDDFQTLIRNKSAAQLQLDNRAALANLGCAQAKVDNFLTTPGYTATNCTAITRALVTMGKVENICGVLDILPPFAGPESILFAQTQIQMAAQFHRTQKPLQSVRYVEGTAVWMDAQGNYYVFSPLEYLYWNEQIDIGLSNIRQKLGPGHLEFWISGTATDTARRELGARGVMVMSDTFSRLWPKK